MSVIHSYLGDSSGNWPALAMNLMDGIVPQAAIALTLPEASYSLS